MSENEKNGAADYTYRCASSPGDYEPDPVTGGQRLSRYWDQGGVEHRITYPSTLRLSEELRVRALPHLGNTHHADAECMQRAATEIERLREVLTVYANPRKWHAGNSEKAFCDNIFLVDDDGWVMAAEALK